MSDYPMLISNKLHSFRNFTLQIYPIGDDIISPQVVILYILYILIIRHLQHPIHIDIFIDTNKTIIDIPVGESSF